MNEERIADLERRLTTLEGDYDALRLRVHCMQGNVWEELVKLDARTVDFEFISRLAVQAFRVTHPEAAQAELDAMARLDALKGDHSA